MKNKIQPTIPPIQPIPQNTTNVQPSNKLFKLLLFTMLGLTVITVWLFIGIQNDKNKTFDQQLVVLPTLQPTQATVVPSIVNTKMVTTQDREKLKNQIETMTNPKMIVEALDISPVESSLVVFLGHNDSWNKFGIYIFDSQTNEYTSIYETTENITGRGGYYKDNTALEFSPTGEAFFVNRTGTNFPSFFIIDSKGKILYKSESDIGNSTWVNGQELVYISEEQILVYSIINQKSEVTKLPIDVFRLDANKTGTQIISFSLPKNELQCQSFDMHIYSYPSGTEIKSIPNTTLRANWTGNNNITYEKVTSCNESQNELSGYVPVTENRTASTL